MTLTTRLGVAVTPFTLSGAAQAEASASNNHQGEQQ